MAELALARCKEKLPCFRIKELKDVLTRLGLSKQGRKQDLVYRIDKILTDEEAYKVWAKNSTLGREEVLNLIEDTYRKMQTTSATDLATTVESTSENNVVKRKEEVNDSYESNIRIRCLCDNSCSAESTIKCDDPKCSVWQHVSCVLIPDKSMTSGLHPDVFYCEICRLSRADPFVITMGHPLNPVKLMVKSIPIDGSNPLQHVEKTFQFTRDYRELLSKHDCDVQAWCMLINDKVPFRMQWPLYPDLMVNDMPVRATNRPSSQALGSNGRDDGSIITPCIRDGRNKISLSASDGRTFCLGVRLIKRRTLQQIRDLIPKDSVGETIEEALARVHRCIGGGVPANDADSDEELVVVAESHVLNLRCPMSGLRIKVAGRFKPCVHLGGFDLDIFLEMNQRSRKWQCPICLKNYSLENVIIDPYFNRITSMMRNFNADVTDIEVKPDGCWRVKTKGEAERRSVGDLASWHSSDGSLCLPVERGGSERMEVANRVKQEVMFDNGACELPTQKSVDTLFLSNKKQVKPVACGQVVIPLSISASGSGKDEEDMSINQYGSGNIECINSDMEYDSMSLSTDPTNQYDETPCGPSTTAQVIVLSDSDDDEPTIISDLRHFGSNGAKVIDVNVPFPLDNLANCKTPLTNGYTSAPVTYTPTASASDAVLSNNLLPFGGVDPSLQIYLAPVPANVSTECEAREPIIALNGNRSDDWTSLTLGGSKSVNHQTPSVNKVLDSRNKPPSGEVTGEAMTDHATLLLGLTGEGSNKASRPRSDSPFSFPRQKRSVRPRTYLSVGDSD